MEQDPIALRTFILKCVNEKLSIEAVDKIFCKKYGKKNVVYTDLGFWYYRFYNGDTDVTHDRRKDLCTKKLTDLNMDVMEEIFSHLNVADRLICSKTNEALHFLSRIKKPKTIELIVDLSEVRMKLDSNPSMINYRKDGETCSVGTVLNDVVIQEDTYSGYNYIKLALINMLSFLKMPEFALKTLSLKAKYERCNKEWHFGIKRLKEFSKLIGSPLRVETFQSVVFDAQHFFLMLKWFQPGVLTHIKIVFRASKNSYLLKWMNKIKNLKQWKEATCLEIRFDVDNYPTFRRDFCSHFETYVPHEYNELQNEWLDV